MPGLLDGAIRFWRLTEEIDFTDVGCLLPGQLRILD